MDGEIEMALVRAGLETGCHWSIKRKTSLLQILQNFPAHEEAVLHRFNISGEEIELWRRAYAKRGEAGLLMKSIPSLRR